MHAELHAEFDLMDVWYAVKTRLPLFGAISACCVALFVLVSFIVTPVFRSEITIIDAVDTGGGADALGGSAAGFAKLAGIDVSSLGAGSRYAHGILHSRLLVEQFIQKNNLLPILFAERWDAKTGTWNVAAEDIPTIREGVEEVIDRVRKIRSDADNGSLVVTVEWSDPIRAAKWANGLVRLANDMVRQNELRTAQAKVAYLQSQIAATQIVDLQKTLYRLVESEMRIVMLANSRAEYAFRIVDPAVEAELPVWPRPLLMALVGAVLGVIFGVLACVVSAMAHRRGGGRRSSQESAGPQIV